MCILGPRGRLSVIAETRHKIESRELKRYFRGGGARGQKDHACLFGNWSCRKRHFRVVEAGDCRHVRHARQLARTRGNDGRVAACIARDELDGSPEDATPLVELFCREKRAVE